MARFGGLKKPSIQDKIKMDKMVKISHFLSFCLERSSFCPKSYLKSALQDKNQIYTSISALVSFKNDQKWEILTTFSILPYTDGFLGPPNLAICTFFKFCLDSSLKIRFFATFWEYFGGGALKPGAGHFGKSS